MPPRWLCVLIMAFWLGTTTWFIYREVWPYYRPGQPPPISFGLTDEVGGSTALWDVFYQNENIGAGKSEVRRRGDRDYELTSEIKFRIFKFGPLEINRITNAYQMTPEGELKRFRSITLFTFQTGQAGNAGAVPFSFDMRGMVDDKMLKVTVESNNALVQSALQVFKPEPIPVQHSVLNTMHLLNRIPGLRLGQYWRVPLFDPSGMLPGVVQGVAIPQLEANVTDGELRWNDEQTPCLKIEYREPGKEATAATWVRRSDALVLRQEATHHGMHIVFHRQPVKEE